MSRLPWTQAEINDLMTFVAEGHEYRTIRAMMIAAGHPDRSNSALIGRYDIISGRRKVREAAALRETAPKAEPTEFTPSIPSFICRFTGVRLPAVPGFNEWLAV